MTNDRHTGSTLPKRAAACFAAALVALCCAVPAAGVAFADDKSSGASAPTANSSAAASPAPSAATSAEPAATATEPATPASTATSASSSTSESNNGPVTTGTTSTATSSDAAAKTDETQPAKEEKSKESEAADKRSQAAALDSQISRLQGEIAKFQAAYDEAKAAHDNAIAQRDEANHQLDLESTGLEVLKSNLNDYVVGLYKQGGSAPYLDVMLRSTSYREFINSWYMANEVPRYAKQVIQEKNELLAELRSQITAFEEQAAEHERAMKAAEVNVRQSTATRYALQAQAATWNAEAARLLGDEGAAESAEREAEELSAALSELIKQGLGGEGSLTGTGYFTHPCPDATYSSGFGYRSFDNAFHKGLDMAAPEGTPYYAADNGICINATNGGGYNGGAGNWVVIDHGNGIVTKYMHSLITFVKPGDQIVRGQNIGLVGNTGNSFGAHLHFQVEVAGTAVNPLGYL